GFFTSWTHLRASLNARPRPSTARCPKSKKRTKRRSLAAADRASAFPAVESTGAAADGAPVDAAAGAAVEGAIVEGVAPGDGVIVEGTAVDAVVVEGEAGRVGTP